MPQCIYLNCVKLNMDTLLFNLMYVFDFIYTLGYAYNRHFTSSSVKIFLTISLFQCTLAVLATSEHVHFGAVFDTHSCSETRMTKNCMMLKQT